MEILRDYGLIFISFVLSIIYAIEPLFMSKLVDIYKRDDHDSLKRNINYKDFAKIRDELKKEVSELISQIKSK